MTGDREDDDIFELTEEMASIPPPAPPVEEMGEEEFSSASRSSSRPPTPKSPFALLVRPKPQTGLFQSDSSTDGESEPSDFAPAEAKIETPLDTRSPADSEDEEPVTDPDTGAQESDAEIEESARPSLESQNLEEMRTKGPIYTPQAQASVDEEEEEGNGVDVSSKVLDFEEPVTDLHPIIEFEQDISVASESLSTREDTTQVDLKTGEVDEHDIPISVEEDELRRTASDFGTPEEVFDSFEEGRDESEEIDLDGAEDITVDVEGMAGGEEDSVPDMSEELDLAEVEELPPSPRASKIPPVRGPATGRRPKMRRRRKRPKEWWADIFDDDYLTLLPPVSRRDQRREADFIEKSLSISKGGLILDLACGYGRHAVSMSKRGYRVVGVDLSLPMLARAGDLAQEADQKINFIHGDMRDLGFDRTFDAVYCLGTSFGYFDEKTNFKVLEGVARALKPKGTFLLEVANRDHVISSQPNLTWFEGPGAVCMEETTFNYASSRLYIKRQLILSGGIRQLKHEVSLRLYSLHELGNMLHQAGFAVSQVAGHTATPGAFFGADSAQIIILAIRR